MPVNIKSEDGGDWAPGVPNPTHVTTSSAAAAAVAGKESDDDDDDDPIVREVDVYLSPGLADQIYLLQYPLQQTQLNRLPTAARIKPRHAQIELDFPIPVAPTTIAGGGSGYCRGAFPFMTRRVFQSQTIPVETHMCLGQLKVDESSDYTKKSSLHLVPLQHISQMRPSFRHVEESNPDDNNNAAANAADGGGQDHNKDDDDDNDHDYNNINNEASEKKPIVFQRKESERAAMIRKSSYAYKKASHDAEEWQDLIVCDATSAEYTSNLNQIVSFSNIHQQATILAPLHNQENDDNDNDDNDNDTDQDWTISHAGMNYIQSLNYVKVSAQEEMMSASSCATTSSVATAGAAGSNNGSNNDIKSIIARMTVLLGNGGPIPYSILRDQFVTSSSSTTDSTSVSDAKLFQALSICAVLVRGNFCLHSKFLNLSKSMQRARTFLLLLFQKYKTVQKSRLHNIDLQLLLPMEDMNTNSSAQQQQQQQQQQVVTLDKLHVLLQQVGKRTNAVVNAVDYNPNNINNHATTTAGWVLRVEDNLAFVAAHPQEAEQHLTYWDRLCTSSPRIKQLLEQYNNAATTDNDGDIDDDSMKS